MRPLPRRAHRVARCHALRVEESVTRWWAERRRMQWHDGSSGGEDRPSHWTWWGREGGVRWSRFRGPSSCCQRTIALFGLGLSRLCGRSRFLSSWRRKDGQAVLQVAVLQVAGTFSRTCVPARSAVRHRSAGAGLRSGRPGRVPERSRPPRARRPTAVPCLSASPARSNLGRSDVSRPNHRRNPGMPSLVRAGFVPTKPCHRPLARPSSPLLQVGGTFSVLNCAARL